MSDGRVNVFNQIMGWDFFGVRDLVNFNLYIKLIDCMLNVVDVFFIYFIWLNINISVVVFLVLFLF